VTAEIALLLVAGLAGGFLAGLLGVGGGIVFAPVLLAYFGWTGVPQAAIVPLTTGTSLLCTWLSAAASAFFQSRRESVDWPTALVTGVFSVASVWLVKEYVTTQSWYTPDVFAHVFAVVLLIVVVRMVTGSDDESEGRPVQRAWLPPIGLGGGALSAAIGIGGGIVLVPAYNRLARLPLRLALGTSSATILITAGAGVLAYALTVPEVAGVPQGTFGAVALGHALALGVPAVFAAKAGVRLGQRAETRYLRWAFAALAAFVALRLLLQ
jgi:uncharacterized membrane protein YfcA